MKTRLLPAAFAWACGFLAPWAIFAAPPKAAAPEPSKVEAPTADIDAQFVEFLKSPTQEGFVKVQKLVMSHPSYAPYSEDLDNVADLLEQEKYKEAQAEFAKAMPNLLLSPRAHRYAATIATKLGDEATAKKEAAIAEKCIKGLLSTGDGSEKRPIIVTRVSDEYDVVHSLKKKVFGQGLHKKDDKSYDELQCSGGTLMSFDVTIPFGTLFKKIEKQEPDKKSEPDKKQ